MPSPKTTGKYTSVVAACVAFIQWLAVAVVTSVRHCVVTCHLLCSRGASGGVDTTASSCSSKSDLKAGEIDTVTLEPVQSEYESADDRIEIVIIATATSASLTRLLQSEADASLQNKDTPGSGSMSGGGYDSHEVYVPAEPESEPIVCPQSASTDLIVAANKENEDCESIELKAIESDDDQATAATTVTTESERASNSNSNEEEDLSDNACLPIVCLELVDDSEIDEEDLEYDTLTDSSSASMSDFDYEDDDEEEDNDDDDLGFHRIDVLDEMIERLLQLNHDMEDDWSSYCTMFE